MANGKENALKGSSGRRFGKAMGHMSDSLVWGAVAGVNAAMAVFGGPVAPLGALGAVAGASLASKSAGAAVNQNKKAKRLDRIGNSGKYKAATTKLKAAKKAAAKKSGGNGVVKTHARRTKSGGAATVKQHMRKGK